MNVLIIIVAAVFVLLMIQGGRQGLLRMLFTLVSSIILIGLIGFATPRITNFLQDNTQIYATVENRCVEKIEEKGLGNLLGDDESDASLQLPKVLDQFLGEETANQIDEKGDEIGTAINTRIAHVLGEKLARYIVGGIAFVIAFAIALVIVRMIGGVLGLVNKIPILGKVNRFLGVIAGAVIALILVWLFMFFVSAFSGGDANSVLLKQINDNQLLEFLYKNNGVVGFVQGYFK